MPDANGTLRITRGKRFADKLRAYQIFAGSDCLGDIREGSEVAFDLPAGRYEITAKIDWACSKPVSVEIRAGEVTTLSVRNTFGAWASFYAITLGKKRYLTLEPV